MKAIIENVTVSSGKVNESKKSENLTVSIPSGMTGRKLAAWKAKNEKQIVEALESADDSESDTCGQP